MLSSPNSPLVVLMLLRGETWVTFSYFLVGWTVVSLEVTDWVLDMAVGLYLG